MSYSLNSNYGVTEVFVKHDYYSKLRIKLVKVENDKTILCEYQGDKIIERQEITNTKKLYPIPKNFLQLDVDERYFYIYEHGEYSFYRYKYIKHQGSSRSSKSWSLEEAAIRECEEEPNTRFTIWRDTQTSLGDTVWKDFKQIFPLSGRKYKFTRNTTPIFFDNNSTIEPQGDDTTNAHGLTQKKAWLNEPYKMSENTFNQIDMRCEQMWIDLNPAMKHWSDKLDNHPRCKVIHSTFQQNPFCPLDMKLKILSYNPDNPINVINGTANNYMWKVYGLGLKAEKPNKIYSGWIPITLEQYNAIDEREYFGLDYGWAKPTALVGIKYDGDRTFYVRPALYKPMNHMKDDGGFSIHLGEFLKAAGFPVGNVTYGWADSSDKEAGSEVSLTNDLRSVYGLNLWPTSKPTYKARWAFITNMRVYYVEDENFEFEYDNYELEYIGDTPTGKPVKKDDHYINAFEYGAWGVKEYLGIIV